MMIALLILCGAVFAFGVFHLFAAIFGAPTAKQVKTTRNILRRKPKEKQDVFTVVVDGIAMPLSKVLPLSKRHIEKLQSSLTAADSNLSARLYLSRCIVKALLLFIVTALASIIVKPLLIVALCMPLLVYASESKKADTQTLAQKTAIERDLPQLVATITAELTASRDVVRMLSEYSKTCGTALRRQLQITVADMESGNYETALTRLGGRCNSAHVSKVVQGLIGVVRGNDEIQNFRIMNYDFKQWEQTNLKKKAQACVPKLNAASMVLMVCIVALMVGVLLIDVLQGAQTFF